MSSNNNFSSSVSKKRGSTSANGGGKCSGKNPRSSPTVTMPTIAASWGAYFPSSSSASKSSSKINRKAPFSDFGSYMTEKNRKLRDQFDADASGSGEGSDIFGGVSIFVNGFTVPSSQELRGFMLKHGGRVENYFSRKRVTHIICSNLPDSKLKNFRSFSRGLPVVKPIWIVDSIEAGKLLSWVPYKFEEDFAESCKQQKLSSFFCVKNISRCTIAEAPAESSESNVSFLKYKEDHIEADCGISVSKSGTGEEALISRPDITEDQNNSMWRLKFSSCRHSKDVPNSSQQWSTVDDSNFVENYFKVNKDVMCAVRGDYSHSGQFDDFVPGSLSQVDISILEQLPVELKTDIVEVLPAHRISENSSDAIEGQARQEICGIGMKGSWYNNINLWDGDPPTWVHEFQVTNCAILNIFAESYLRCAKARCLSSILLDMLSKFPTSLHSIEEGLDEAFSGTCELLIQYINIKLKEDVEEIYVCFRLLRRFALGSRFFLHVLDEVLPLLQASVSECYGGKLSISVVN